MQIGQSPLDPVSIKDEAFVIQAQQLEERRVEIIHTRLVHRRREPELVALPVI